MADVLLEVENLRVDYEDLTAVNGISFSVEAGMVYGLIGPNGAGKTSTIRAISTLGGTDLRAHADQRNRCGVGTPASLGPFGLHA